MAADEAVKASGLDMGRENRTLAGCITGTGIGGIHEIEASKVLQVERGADRVSPFFIPKIMANAMAGQAAIRFGLKGTCFVTSSACASAGHAIGMALRSIQWGEADIMLTGGSEAATTELGLAGFCSLKALSLADSGRGGGHARASALWYTAGVLLSFLAIGAIALALRAAGQALGWGFQLQQPVNWAAPG